MEFTLRENLDTAERLKQAEVLILVFVEFTLRETKKQRTPPCLICLNPCFCGIYSQRFAKKVLSIIYLKVLILVFVEFTLRDKWTYTICLKEPIVLILVFVEFTLRGDTKPIKEKLKAAVLILVFVEFTLRDRKEIWYRLLL